MKLKALVFVTLSLSISFSWASSDCNDLVGELRAMKKAQQVILQSLADNHQKFSLTLSELATETELANGKVSNTVIKSMRESSRSFKNRGQTAENQADKLGEATSDLIERVESCLVQ